MGSTGVLPSARMLISITLNSTNSKNPIRALRQPSYGIIVVVWPGLATVMTPAQLHMQVEMLSSAG